MNVEIIVPDLGESITEVEIGTWYPAEGEEVELDDPIVEIESAKATLDIPSPASGVLVSIIKARGEPAGIGEVIGTIESKDGDKPAPPSKKPTSKSTTGKTSPAPNSAPRSDETAKPRTMPAAAKMMETHRIDESEVEATGPGGRILKEDVTRVAESTTKTPPKPGAKPVIAGAREERTERMSLVRRTIASRLVAAKQEAALLTTFNEVDMSKVKALRAELKDSFVEKHGLKLGFMSFFVKATVAALGETPGVNGEIRGDSIVYRDYYDIGVAIGGGKGLVVPVIRDADRLSFAGIEGTIADFAARAKNGTLRVEELEGGTFTISNGGVYGSMLSTPIINPPQSGILGLHAIRDRAVVVNGEIVARPVMYVALTYDHRIVDGREAVTFLRGIKERIESPGRLLLEV